MGVNFYRAAWGRLFDDVTMSRDLNEVREPCSHLNKELCQR